MATQTEKLAMLLSQEATAIWCFAVPGENNIIDTVNPDTQKTHIYGKTLADVRAERPEYAQAELMRLDHFCAEKAARQHAPILWIETTQEKFNYMLGCLPPADSGGRGFLVGEPYDHDASNGQPRFSAFKEKDGKYWASSRPMTRPEFHKEMQYTGTPLRPGLHIICKSNPEWGSWTVLRQYDDMIWEIRGRAGDRILDVAEYKTHWTVEQ